MLFRSFHQALEGIRHAHDAGVVHRDVKGSNLMLDERGVVKVMDFGIARVVGSERRTRVGNLVGTPEYMSPEQIRGEDATTRSDLYSLGILLYEMLTGRVPFQQKGEFDVLRAQVEQPPPPPRQLCPSLSEAMEAALLRALAKKPEDRFTSIAEFQAVLVAAGAPPVRPALAPTALAVALPSAEEAEPSLPSDAGTRPLAPAALPETMLLEESSGPSRALRVLQALGWPLAGLLLAAALMLSGDALLREPAQPRATHPSSSTAARAASSQIGRPPDAVAHGVDGSVPSSEATPSRSAPAGRNPAPAQRRLQARTSAPPPPEAGPVAAAPQPAPRRPRRRTPPEPAPQPPAAAGWEIRR